MVKGEPECHVASSVVTGDPELFEPEVPHEGHGVVGKRAFRVRGVIGRRSGLRAVAEPSKVRTDDGKLLSEPGGDEVPHDMGLGVAVEEKERWTATAVTDPEIDVAEANRFQLESLEHGVRDLRRPIEEVA